MTATCPVCQGDGEIETDAEEPSAWDVPPGSGEASADGEHYRLEWHPRAGVTKRALFRVATDDRVAILEHIRTIHLRQLGPASNCRTDTDPALEDVPRALLATMEADGFRPADVGEVVA